MTSHEDTNRRYIRILSIKSLKVYYSAFREEICVKARDAVPDGCSYHFARLYYSPMRFASSAHGSATALMFVCASATPATRTAIGANGKSSSS